MTLSFLRSKFAAAGKSREAIQLREKYTKLYCVALLALTAVAHLGAQSTHPHVEVFFNYPVASEGASLTGNTGSSISAKAVQLVEGAQSTIDLAAYNFDHAPLASALRRAHARGVRVRVVTDVETQHPSLLSPNPDYTWIEVNDAGLMHHKFLLVDADDPARATVMTGSTNFTDANIYSFYNDALVLRSAVLAQAYQHEMNLLWGSTTAVPDFRNSLTGAEKPQRAVTTTRLDNLDIELYFSPNDEVSTRIEQALDVASTSVAVQLLVFTYDQLADALVRAVQRGVAVTGVIENVDDASSDYSYVRSRGAKLEAHTPDEVVHHKYAVIDAQAGDAATIITGSHNWSYSAETFHDENTLIITGSAALAELYYEAARSRHCDLAGGVACAAQLSSAEELLNVAVTVSPNPVVDQLTLTSESFTSATVSAYRILDVLGRQVQAGLLSNQFEQITLDCSSLSPGQYSVQLRTERAWTRGIPFLSTI